MSGDNVRLIVKSANQETSAHVIDCKSFWNIHQVKCHLAKVFPGKPPVEEQKIIYFGQLLSDDRKLKDVLRSTDDVSTYTIHLVYTPKERPSMFGPMVPDMPPPNLNFGLRQRHTEGPLPEMSENDQNHSVEIQNYLNNVMNYGRVPPYPPVLEAGLNRIPIAERFAQYHESYVQYMQQYARWYSTNQNAAAATPQNADNVQPAAAQPPAENQAAPAAGENADDPRDWLDWTYAASRAAMLFMLIWFYSSPFRLLLVIIICIVLYLHKSGFLRQLGIQNNERQHQQQQQQNQPDNQGQNQPAADNQQPAQPNEREEPNSFLGVTWMIVLSFFTSLIPEVQ